MRFVAARLDGTACCIWLEIESTAFRTLPTAPLTRSVTELEVTEVARDKKDVKPPLTPSVRRFDRLSGVPEVEVLSEPSTLCDDMGANVTLFDLLLLTLLAGEADFVDCVDRSPPTISCFADVGARGKSPIGSGKDVV